MLPRRCPSLLLLLALSVLPLKAQTRGGGRAIFSIDGYVRDDTNHQPMDNVRVDLKQLGGTPLNTTFTRDNGQFEFDGLGNGEYVVEVVLKGYEPVRQSVSIVNASSRGVSLFLARAAKVVNPGGGTTISAHQLSVPHRAHDEFEKGMILAYGKSDYHGAIDEFQRAIKDFPTYYEAYAEEGAAYFHLEETGPAEEALRKSIDLSSGQYADPFFTLAAILNDNDHSQDAADMARRGITADTSSWRGPFELARALAAQKQFEDAEKSAQRSRDLMPDNPPVYLLLANIHLQRRDYSSLLRDLDDYLRLAPSGSDAERARKLRENVKAILNPPQGASTVSGPENPQAGASESHPAPAKESPPPLEPDTSGLPSLPPPSPAN